MTMIDRLPQDLFEPIAILSRGAESVGAVMHGETNRFSQALSALAQLAETESIPIAIVCGLGAIRYGYPAATQDIDIAVGRSDLDQFVRLAPRYGFKVAWEAKTGWHILTHGDVEINVVPESGKAKNTAPTTIPGPPALGVSSGLGYASLAGWLELKISFGRQKDKAHVVEVLKVAPPDGIAELRAKLAEAHSTYAQTFDELHEQALEEKQQEDERGGS